MSGHPVCFHRRRTCGFCSFPPKAMPRARRRCPACGRFVAKGRAAAHCARCVERGFRAVRLPLAG